MSSGDGEIVKSGGQDYQAVTLNVNGVTKRVLVPMSSENNDDFIPTPDNPFPPSKNAAPVSTVTPKFTHSGFQQREIAPKPMPPQVLRVTPASSALNVQQMVRSQFPGANVQQIRIPSQLAPTASVQNQPTRITLPLSGFNFVSTPPAQKIQMALPPRPGPVKTAGQSTVIQTGTLIQPNITNPGSAVQYGTIAMRPPTTPIQTQPIPIQAQTVNVVRQNPVNTFPQQGVYKIDSSGQIQLVSSAGASSGLVSSGPVNSGPVTFSPMGLSVQRNVVHNSQLTEGTTSGPVPISFSPMGFSVQRNLVHNPQVTTAPAPRPQQIVLSNITKVVTPQPPALARMPVAQTSQPTPPQGLTLSTPDGKVFSVPDHLLPTTIASVLNQPPAVTTKMVRVPISIPTQPPPQQQQQQQQKPQQLNMSQIKMPLQTFPSPSQVKVTFSQPPGSVQTANIPNLTSASRPVTLPNSSVAQNALGVNITPGSFVNIAPKPNMGQPNVPMGVATIMHGRNELEDKMHKQKKTPQGVETSQYEKSYYVERNKDLVMKLSVSPKAKHRSKDKPYRPPPNFHSPSHQEISPDRRRSGRIKTKPCSVRLTRLNLKRNATVNLSEIPLSYLD